MLRKLYYIKTTAFRKKQFQVQPVWLTSCLLAAKHLLQTEPNTILLSRMKGRRHTCYANLAPHFVLTDGKVSVVTLLISRSVT